MKELTIEEKAQRYDEALKVAKGLYAKDAPDSLHLERMFPELKESEGERIRKHLIGVVELYYGNTDEQEKKDCLAWLEKQGGQKPAEEVNGEDYGIDSLWHAQNILERTLGKVDGYQSDDGILEHKCAITAVKKLYGQKPTVWSEEDEAKIVKLKSFIAQCKGFNKENRFIAFDLIDSIRPRHTWKPSREQMEYLHKYAEQNNYDGAVLTSLYKDLKQLKQF